MSESRRILIVSASTGNGHLRAGEALRQVIGLQYPDWRVEHLDVLSLGPRWVRAAYRGGFELLAAKAPRVWGELYRWADGPEGDPARWGAIVERTLFRPFHRLLRAGGWDLCLCTHFLPSQLAAGLPGVPPFALVVTDYTLHRYWAQPRVGRYFVATDELRDGIMARLPNAHVTVTGIPVDPSFSRMVDSKAIRNEMGLDPDRPVVLIAGGGLGIGVEESVAAVAEAQLNELQVVAVCGRNGGAFERLHAQYSGRGYHIKGYVVGIERFFAAADAIITKPGGLTTSEALASGRPLILTRGLPGHETNNVHALTGMNAAVSAPTPAQLTAAVRTLFGTARGLGPLREAALRHGRPTAARDIMEQLDDELQVRVVAA